MGDTTNISWTERTWNPWRGCAKVSAGCKHCYMFTDQMRYGKDPKVVVRAAPNTFNAPLSQKWAEPALVFTCSWSDWFIESADEWRPEAWDIIRRTPHLTYQILTKRPELAAERLPDDWGDGYPNVWLGVSIEDRRFVGRADVLRTLPAACRFISAEPLLGPLIPELLLIKGVKELSVDWLRHDISFTVTDSDRAWIDGGDEPGLNLDGIDWLIAGGESGADARRMDPDWARGLRDACSRSGTAFHFKQLGVVLARELGAHDRKGEDPAEHPEDLRVREFPMGRAPAQLPAGPEREARLF